MYYYGTYTTHWKLSKEGFAKQECKCCCASMGGGKLYCVPLSMSSDFYYFYPGCYKVKGPRNTKVMTYDMDKFWPRLDINDMYFNASYPDEDLMNAPDRVLERLGNGDKARGEKELIRPQGALGWTSATTRAYVHNDESAPNNCVEQFNREMS